MSRTQDAKPAGTVLFKLAGAALAGSCIEWYDFFIYGTAAALVFPRLFFPHDLPPAVAQFAAFSTFAVGFVARPIGGAVFGHIGDRVGRKFAMVTALVLMGAATVLMGLLPSYAAAGVIAPIGLVVLRFVQGFAVGGQWGGAVLLMTESAPPGRRGLFGSFPQMGVPAGVVVANLTFLLINAVISPDAFQAWGWRIPFLLSVVLIGLGLYIQTRLEDTPVFRQLLEQRAKADAAGAKAVVKAKRSASPILDVIRRHPRQILLVGGSFLASNGCFYVCITYVITYGVTIVGLPRNVLLMGVLIGSAVMTPLLLLTGSLSDRWGRRNLYMAGAALTGLFSFAFFPLVETGTAIGVAAAVTGALACMSVMYGPQAAFFAEQFGAEVRYSGASLGYQLGAIFGGGFAPIIATALFAQYRTSFAIAVYMAALSAVSLVCVYLLTDASRLKARPVPV